MIGKNLLIFILLIASLTACGTKSEQSEAAKSSPIPTLNQKTIDGITQGIEEAQKEEKEEKYPTLTKLLLRLDGWLAGVQQEPHIFIKKEDLEQKKLEGDLAGSSTYTYIYHDDPDKYLSFGFGVVEDTQRVVSYYVQSNNYEYTKVGVSAIVCTYTQLADADVILKALKKGSEGDSQPETYKTEKDGIRYTYTIKGSEYAMMIEDNRKVAP